MNIYIEYRCFQEAVEIYETHEKAHRQTGIIKAHMVTKCGGAKLRNALVNMFTKHIDNKRLS